MLITKAFFDFFEFFAILSVLENSNIIQIGTRWQHDKELVSVSHKLGYLMLGGGGKKMYTEQRVYLDFVVNCYKRSRAHTERGESVLLVHCTSHIIMIRFHTRKNFTKRA